MGLVEEVEKAFRFKIGDGVCFRRDVVSLEAETTLNGPRYRDFAGRSRSGFDRVGAPRMGTVIERLVQQCHGGIQLQYRVAIEYYNDKARTRVIDTFFGYELASFDEGMAAMAKHVPADAPPEEEKKEP